ncbi:MAG: HAD family hydrolase [Patescibacteria group bacterium]|jgi:pyrophosphatase PpaX
MNTQKTFEYILFDWDGCLGDSLELWYEAYRKLFQQYGVALTRHAFTEKVLGDWEGPAQLGIQNLTDFNEKLLKVAETKVIQANLNSNTSKTLKVLKQRGKKLAIVTNSSRQAVEKSIVHNRLTGMFDVVLGIEDVKQGKPHPEIVEKAVALLGANKSQTLVVGDLDKDILAGKGAGITTVWYRSKTNSFQNNLTLTKVSADYVINDFSELVEIVN